VRAHRVATALLACAGPVLGQAVPDRISGGPEDPAELGALVDEFFEREMAESHIPGAVFLMVKGGEVFYAQGYGLADMERGIPVDPERTVFRVGSNSKSLTAAALMTLLDDGRVDLDTDVNEYLRRVRVPEAFGAPVTLRQLLTHTAGFDERLFGQHAPLDRVPLSLEDFLAERLPPRTGPPGEVISYNDFGTSLGGLVVQDVTGRPFAAYVADRIFEPLGMTGASFDVTNLPDRIRSSLATAYRYRDGEYRPYAYDVIQTAPAAGLVATARDMGRFMAALLAGGALDGRRVLSDSITATMLARQFGHSPLLRGRAFGFVESDEDGVRGLYKDGQATGFLSRMFLIPDAEIGFFASVNLSILDPGPSFNRVSGIHRRLTTAILDRYFWPSDSTYFDTPTAPDPDPGFDASPYVGTYRAMEGSRRTLEKILFLGNETVVREGADGRDGTLLVGGMPYVPVEPDVFQYAGGGPYYVAFRRDRRGRATHLFIGAGALERTKWLDTSRTTVLALAVIVVVLLTGMVGWSIAALAARRRVAEGRPHPGRAPLVIASALALAFVLGFGWIFSRADLQDFFKGVPSSIGTLLILPLVAVPPTVAACIHSVRAWRGGRGRLAARVHYSVVTLGLIAYYLLLNNWYMVGWRY